MTAPNGEQAEFWNGGGGQVWVDFQSDLDQVGAQAGQRLLEAADPQPGEVVRPHLPRRTDVGGDAVTEGDEGGGGRRATSSRQRGGAEHGQSAKQAQQRTHWAMMRAKCEVQVG